MAERILNVREGMVFSETSRGVRVRFERGRTMDDYLRQLSTIIKQITRYYEEYSFEGELK